MLHKRYSCQALCESLPVAVGPPSGSGPAGTWLPFIGVMKQLSDTVQVAKLAFQIQFSHHEETVIVPQSVVLMCYIMIMSKEYRK